MKIGATPIRFSSPCFKPDAPKDWKRRTELSGPEGQPIGPSVTIHAVGNLHALSDTELQQEYYRMLEASNEKLKASQLLLEDKRK